MNSFKKWLVLSTIIIFISYLLLLLYIIINPDMIFKNSLTKHKFGYTEYYSKYQYLQLKHEKYHLIFGTSQSHKISSDFVHENILNFHNLYGQPNVIYNFLKQLDSTQIKNIKSIYILVTATTMEDKKNLLDYSNTSIIDKLLHVLPLNNTSIKNIIRDIVYNLKNKYPYKINNDGSLYNDDINKTTILSKNLRYQKSSINSIKNSKSIETLITINKFCNINKIPLVFFTPTYSEKFIINLQALEYIWGQLFDKGITSFYGLYYIDKISNNQIKGKYLNFEDDKHLNNFTTNKVFMNYPFTKSNKLLITNKVELKKYFELINRKYINVN